MFDEKYYEDKKQKIAKKFEENKDRALSDMARIMSTHQRDQSDLQERFNEIIKQEEESKKKSEESKQKVEEKEEEKKEEKK